MDWHENRVLCVTLQIFKIMMDEVKIVQTSFLFFLIVLVIN